MLRSAAAVISLAAAVAFATAAVDAHAEPPIQLSFVHPHAPLDEPEQARALFADVNAVRAQHGLRTLTADPRLAKLASEIAHQMAERHYFGHTDPNGVTFEDRLRANGYRYHFAAENMAFDQDEAHANQALLHSAGHFANIVDPAPTRLGVAAVSAGAGEVFYVEEFSD